MYIYIIKNIVNGKIYVGQTITSCRKRWTQHLHDARRGSNYIISKAIRLYGEKNFSIIELCKCNNSWELDEAEKFYIWVLAANKHSFGYNNSIGGKIFGPTTLNTKARHAWARKEEEELEGILLKMKRNSESVMRKKQLKFPLPPLLETSEIFIETPERLKFLAMIKNLNFKETF